MHSDVLKVQMASTWLARSTYGGSHYRFVPSQNLRLDLHLEQTLLRKLSVPDA